MPNDSLSFANSNDEERRKESQTMKNGNSSKILESLPYLTLNVPQMILGLSDPPLPEPRQHLNVISMLDHRAQYMSDTIAVGFPSCTSGCILWTYKDLQTISNRMGNFIIKQLKNKKEDHILTQKPTFALISPSGPLFLAHVLACWRLGCSILPIALGTTAKGALSLIENTGARYILADKSQVKFIEEIKSFEKDQNIEMLQWFVDDPKILTESIKEGELQDLQYDIQPDDLLVIFHSSGSSGNPKPIKHPHKFWTYSLRSAFGIKHSAFTTTPLFHGGLSDLLRSFQAGSKLYMFGWHENKPPSSENIVNSIKFCKTKISYFLSVPFILEMLLKDEKSIKVLQSMDLVSTGGAPLSQQIGDLMIEKYNIKLVSRLGSSECGFLMSSWRNFDKEKDWSWLRLEDDFSNQWLKFEKQQEGEELYELIVSNKWPSKLLSNRKDESFATSDLYKRHPIYPGRWLYSRRADDGIVMVNGKKIASTPIEESFKSHEQIHDAIVFGSNRPFLGAIIELKGSMEIQEMRRSSLNFALKDVNRNLPSHAKIGQEMVHIVNQNDSLFTDLPKSSKGTLQRGLALDKLSELIDSIYSNFEKGEAPIVCERKALQGENLLEWLRDTVENILGKSVKDDEDLYSAGIDSIMAVKIRASVHQYLDIGEIKLGSNVIYDYPTLSSLAKHIESGMKNSIIPDQESIENIQQKYSNFDDFNWSKDSISAHSSATMLLTGATGTLGSRILYELIQDSKIEHIICHVRSNDDEEAKRRIINSLNERKLNLNNLQSLFEDKVSFIRIIDEDNERLIKSKKAIIIHCGWIVNFALNVKSFEKSCLDPLQKLIKLFGNCKKPFKFIFCSSLATILNGKNPFLENISNQFSNSGKTGYGQSKWIAEQICLQASKSISQQNSKAKIMIARIGQLCGDSENGIWNETEAWPLLVRTANEVGCLPIQGPNIDWLRVDVAAKVVIDLSFSDVQQLDPLEVVHVALPMNKIRPTWKDFIDWLSSSQLTNFAQLPNEEWLDKVRQAGGKIRGNALLSIWQNLSNEKQDDFIETKQCEKYSPSLLSAEPIDKTLTHKFVQQWISTGFCT